MASKSKLVSDWNHTLPTIAHIYMSVLCRIIGLKYEVQEHGYHMNFLTLVNFIPISFE